jgi:hypothetical protein
LARTLVLVERRGATLSPAADKLKQMVLAEFEELAAAA